MRRNQPKNKVKTAARRKSSSTKWLQRQINDPYVERAHIEGYRSRAAYKLKEMDEKLDLLRAGQIVVDLGAAPGGWSQIASEKNCKVIALDLLAMDNIADVDFVQMDFTDDEAPSRLLQMLGGKQADLVMSDMSPNTTGHKATDHVRIIALVEMAYEFATEVLSEGGTFIAKVFQGGAENNLLAKMKKEFHTVKHIKPPASRKESSEQYVVAKGYKNPAS